MNKVKVSKEKLNEKIKQELLEKIKTGSGNTWNPQPGDFIAGTVLGVDVKKGKIGKKTTETKLCTLETLEGVKLGVWMKTVIENRFNELNIQIGDIVGIQYEGKKKNYHNYNVVKH